MIFLTSAALFFLGAVVASFIGVVVARLYTGQSMCTGRSHCDACDTVLPPFALIPIISHFVLGGRAHCCGARVSFYAPITECILGAFFVLTYLKLGLVGGLPWMLVSITLLFALVLYDLSHQILPSVLLFPFIVASTITGFLLASSPTDFFSTLFTAFFISASLALIHFISRGRAMGFGCSAFFRSRASCRSRSISWICLFILDRGSARDSRIGAEAYRL